MNMRERKARPRPYRRRWQDIFGMYASQWPPLSLEGLEERAQRVTRELNRLDDRLRHDAWRFSVCEQQAGLQPGQLENLTDRQLNQT